MSNNPEKVINLPTIKNVDVAGFSRDDAYTTLDTSGYQKQQFVGDVYTNKGRFGGSENYWTIGENDLFATYASAGNLYFRAGKTNFADTTNGFCWGIDSGTPKFILGDDSSSVDWAVTTPATLTITGAGIVSPTISYGKTSFTDSTNAGYWISSAGVYLGTASDTTYLKYNISTASFYVKVLEGVISGWTLSTTDLTSTTGGNTTILSSGATAFTAGPTGSPTTTITQAGVLTTTSALIGAFTIGATTITGGTLTLNSAGSIYQGKTSFTDSTNAGYYLGSEGLYCGAAADATLIKYAVATGLIDLVGTISSRSTATIAAAINSSGNLVNDIINLRLDTSAKNILSDFAFGSADYSGSLKCGTITWNATTGAITGGSGGVFHKGGIVFANAGVATITLDATTGNATFAGTLSAAAGTIGAITLATGGNIKLGQTAYATGTGFWLGDVTGTSKLSIGSDTDYLTWDGSKLTIAGTIVNLDTSTGDIIGATFNGSPLSFDFIFGSGSDGDVTISSNTNLTRDMFYDNLTITGSNIWLNPAGFRIFVKGILTIATTCRIQRDGNNGGDAGDGENGHAGDAVGGSAGAAGGILAGGSIPEVVAGKAGQIGGAANYATGIGAAGIAGTDGNSVAKSVGVSGGIGGGGGAGGGLSGGGGGNGSSAGSQTGTVYNQIKTTSAAYLFSDWQASTLVNFTGSSGSGSGGSGGAGGGQANAYAGAGGGSGGSGSPGGIIWVSAKTIVLNGDITAYGGNGGKGGKGGDATGTANGAGGGGGGGGGAAGSGGVIVVIYSKKTGAGTIIAPAGVAGAFGNGGVKYGTGSQAVDGSNGVAGSGANTGTAIILVV